MSSQNTAIPERVLWEENKNLFFVDDFKWPEDETSFFWSELAEIWWFPDYIIKYPFLNRFNLHIFF